MINPGMKKYFMMASVLGFALLAADLWNAVVFGLSVGGAGPFIYGGIALASGVLLVIAAYFWINRSANPLFKPVVFGILAVYPMIFGLNVWSQIGVVSADRMSDVQHASLQDGKRADVAKERDEAEQRLKVFTERLAKLNEQNGWVASVKAEALRDELKTIEDTIASESQSQNGGCKRRCLDAMNAKKRINERITVAEQRDDLDKQITATQKILNDARAKLASTSAGDSKTRNASRLYGKLLNASLSKEVNDAQVDVANEGTGIATAIILCLAAAIMTLVSAIPHLTEPAPVSGIVRAPSFVPAQPTAETAAPAPPASHTREILQPIQVIDSAWDKLIANLKANPTTAALL